MQNAQPGNNSWLGIDSLLAKLLRSEIVSSKQRNSVLSHRAKLYSPLLPAGNLAGDSQFRLRSKFSSPKANIAAPKEKSHPDWDGFSFGARDGTRTHTAKPHAPQTCLSTIPTLSQVLKYYNRQQFFCQYLLCFITGLFTVADNNGDENRNEQNTVGKQITPGLGKNVISDPHKRVGDV